MVFHDGSVRRAQDVYDFEPHKKRYHGLQDAICG
jgi:hypothetical protein